MAVVAEIMPRINDENIERTNIMEMTPRERVMAALRLEATDRAPHCELFVDVAMAEKLLNQKLGQAATGGSVRSNPYTVFLLFLDNAS